MVGGIVVLSTIVATFNVNSAQAWTSPTGMLGSRIPTAHYATSRSRKDFEVPDNTQITSVNMKEIAWDSKTGRFFETNLETDNPPVKKSSEGLNPFTKKAKSSKKKVIKDDLSETSNLFSKLLAKETGQADGLQKDTSNATPNGAKLEIPNPFSTMFSSTEATESGGSNDKIEDEADTGVNPFSSFFSGVTNGQTSPPATSPSRSPASIPTGTASKATESGTNFIVQPKIFKWNGYDVYSQVSKQQTGPALPFSSSGSDKPVALLIHGFGCSTTYWRATTEYLINDGYEVHAIDLLGQGQSDKPGRDDGIEYSINLWANIVDDYIQQNVGGGSGVVLMGNSLGSVVALSVATGDFATSGGGYVQSNGLTKGLCLFNCGIGMNSQGVIDEPQWNFAQRTAIRTLFFVLNTLLFGNQPLLSYVLGNVVTRDFLRSALENLYLQNPDRVDDELVESFYLPAKQDGAVDALSQIYTNNPGKTPQQLYNENADSMNNIPIQVVWGDKDPVAPMSGPVGQFFSGLSEEPNSNVKFETITNCGHVPFDDAPVQSNTAMMKWMDREVMGNKPLLEGLFGR